VVLTHSNTGEQLTSWMFSHSGQWFWSAQTLENNSLAGYPAILVSDSDLSSTGEQLTSWTLSHSGRWFWSARTLESNSQTGCPAILVSGSDLLKHWRATHILYVFPIYLISKIHVHLLVLPLYPLKEISRFQYFTPRNSTYILPAFHKPDIFSQVTRYCTHILNHKSISDDTDYDIRGVTWVFFSSASANTLWK